MYNVYATYPDVTENFVKEFNDGKLIYLDELLNGSAVNQDFHDDSELCKKIVVAGAMLTAIVEHDKNGLPDGVEDDVIKDNEWILPPKQLKDVVGALLHQIATFSALKTEMKGDKDESKWSRRIIELSGILLGTEDPASSEAVSTFLQNRPVNALINQLGEAAK